MGFPDQVFIPKGTDIDKFFSEHHQDEILAVFEGCRSEETKGIISTEFMKREQPDCSVIHRFGPGIYIRESVYPAGIYIVGQTHRHEHMNILLKGSILVMDGNGQTARLDAPFIFTAPAGSKVGCTLTEVVWQNIYATDKKDVEVLEKELFIAPDYYNAHTKERLEAEYPLHDEDRKDFLTVLSESGWTEQEVSKISAYRGDCIDFPYGAFPIQSANSPIHGKGLFASAFIPQNTVIVPMRINGKRTPAGYLVNHSRNPNCIADIDAKGDIFLISIRDIGGMKGGDLVNELTLDYRQIMHKNGFWRSLS